jgi:hypothetical protein
MSVTCRPVTGEAFQKGVAQMETTITSGQLSALLKLLNEKGMTPERWNEISSSGLLADLCDRRTDLMNRAAVCVALGLNIIDGDGFPFPPKTHHVLSNHDLGQIYWDPDKAFLWSLPGGQALKGLDLYQQIKDQPLLNAAVLEFLLRYPHLLPESWKDEEVAFLGTIYSNLDGRQGVRVLYWDKERWDWEFADLDCHWPSRRSIAMFPPNLPLFPAL